MTTAVMFLLAAGKARTGRALENPVPRTEGRVTMIDGILAAAVLLGLVLNATLGRWWADPAAVTHWSTTLPARYRKSSPANDAVRTPAGPRSVSARRASRHGRRR